MLMKTILLKIIKNLAFKLLDTVFIMLINVKMPIIVCILTFIMSMVISSSVVVVSMKNIL